MIPTYTPPQLSAPNAAGQRAAILAVDDQPSNIQLLYAILGDDYDVAMATSGEDALRLCEAHQPDLILLDIQMPGLSGFEVCERLKERAATHNIPIIFVTAQTTANEETRALRGGAVDFIAKPFNPDVVKARVRTHVQLKQQSDLLRTLAFVDPLTGLANRRRFEENLRAEWRRCQRHRMPLALIMIDVDHFKAYNDHYGHQIGDACLQLVAQTLARHFGRGYDLVARYGGEEFVCLLPECDLAGAAAKAETLRAAVEALRIEHAASATASIVTISLGVHAAVPDADHSSDALAATADRQLYVAKSSGRNRVAAETQG